MQVKSLIHLPGLCLTFASDPILEETFFKSGGFASPTGALIGGIS